MRSILVLPVCVALLASTSCAFAATDMPAEGAYGFDWSRSPESAQCVAVTKALIRKFRKCEVADGSFGGDPVKARKCTIDKHSEYMVYESKAACVNALETEKANE